MRQLRDRQILTDEDRHEHECHRQAAIEREIDRGDYLRDEMKDRQMEEMWEAMEKQKTPQDESRGAE